MTDSAIAAPRTAASSGRSGAARAHPPNLRFAEYLRHGSHGKVVLCAGL